MRELKTLRRIQIFILKNFETGREILQRRNIFWNCWLKKVYGYIYRK